MKKIFYIASIVGISSFIPTIGLLSISCSTNKNNPSKELDSNGGRYNGLQIDKYLSIIKLLNLNSQIILSSLTSDGLTEKLKETNQNYKELSLSILEGSNETSGILKLKLNGKFNNKIIDETITISGFTNIVENNIKVDNFKLNYENYFNNYQPIIGSNNLQLSEDIKIRKSIISNANFNINNQSLSFELMQQKYNLKEINVSVQNNQLKFTNFTFETKFQKYENGKWVLNDQQKEFRTRSFLIDLPTLKDLMKFMISKFTLKEENFKNYYASEFKGLFNLSIELKADKTSLLNFIEYDSIIQKFKSSYFPSTKIHPQVDITNKVSLITNDFDNSISFVINLINFENENDLTISKIFTSTNFKNIKTFIDEQKDKINRIIIKDTDNSSLSKSIKKMFKNDIDQMFAENKVQNKKLQNDNFVQLLNNSWNNVYIQENNNNLEYSNKINESYNLSLFDQQLNSFDEKQGQLTSSGPFFDIDTGLFKSNKNEIFMIENIIFEYDKNNIDINLQMNENTNLVFLTFNAKMKMSISNKEFIQTTKFSLTITRSSWTKP